MGVKPGGIGCRMCVWAKIEVRCDQKIMLLFMFLLTTDKRPLNRELLLQTVLPFMTSRECTRLSNLAWLAQSFSLHIT